MNVTSASLASASPLDGSSTGTSADNSPAKRKIGQAAHDFEALLVEQMLRSSHGEDGWLGTGDDKSDDAAMGMGEEQLAQALANSGGLGLAKMIEAGLAAPPSGH